MLRGEAEEVSLVRNVQIIRADHRAGQGQVVEPGTAQRVIAPAVAEFVEMDRRSAVHCHGELVCGAEVGSYTIKEDRLFPRAVLSSDSQLTDAGNGLIQVEMSLIEISVGPGAVGVADVFEGRKCRP